MFMPPFARDGAAQSDIAGAPADLSPWFAFAELQASATAEWLALCQETWTRCSLSRDPLDYLSIGGLMLPAWVSHAMHYYKRLSALTQTGHPTAIAEPPAHDGNSTATMAMTTDTAHAAAAVAVARKKPAAFDAHDAEAPGDRRTTARQARRSAKTASETRQSRGKQDDN